MTQKELIDILRKDDDCAEFLHFERIPAENRFSQRPDLHAFMLLDKLIPGTIVAAAEHDIFWISIELEELAQVATPEQVIELQRCGMVYDRSVGSLAFYV